MVVYISKGVLSGKGCIVYMYSMSVSSNVCSAKETLLHNKGLSKGLIMCTLHRNVCQVRTVTPGLSNTDLSENFI